MLGAIPYSGGGAWGGGTGGLIIGKVASAKINPPVYLPTTEANADENTFVCEFLGGANANETGAGLGLFGSDLVFTQVGSIPGSIGGYRTLTATGRYFTATAAFIAAWANNPEFTYALKFVSLTPAESKRMFAMIGVGTNALAYYVYTSSFASNNLFLDTVANRYMSIISSVPNTVSPTWLCVWRKNGNLHAGWKTQETIPTGWDDFPNSQRSVLCGLPILSDTWSTTRNVVNDISGGGLAYSIGTVIASKIGLAAAPV